MDAAPTNRSEELLCSQSDLVVDVTDGIPNGQAGFENKHLLKRKQKRLSNPNTWTCIIGLPAPP